MVEWRKEVRGGTIQSSMPNDFTTKILAQSRREMVITVMTPKAMATAMTLGPCVSAISGDVEGNTTMCVESKMNAEKE